MKTGISHLYVHFFQLRYQYPFPIKLEVVPRTVPLVHTSTCSYHLDVNQMCSKIYCNMCGRFVDVFSCDHIRSMMSLV